jgi:cephalosporin hydroxylase
MDNDVVEGFHREYYERGEQGGTWKQTRWMGVETWKCPLDLWVYQELLHELRPDLVIETGTAYGGSALYLAQLCDLLGQGEVVTIDTQRFEGRPQHPRVTYLFGSSTDDETLSTVAIRAERASTVLVLLDSDHRQQHVAAELRAYAPLVTPGSYLVVEDTNVNGHPVFPAFGPGPMEAVEEFLAANPAFEADRAREKFLLTFNPKGFLQRRS